MSLILNEIIGANSGFIYLMKQNCQIMKGKQYIHQYLYSTPSPHFHELYVSFNDLSRAQHK